MSMKTERGERVFPVSDHSSDVIRALKRLLEERKVKICLRTAVKRLLVEDKTVSGVLLSDGVRDLADAVVLATGGLSYPSTGSTGDGFRMAKACGHRLIEQEPSLVPLIVREEWCRELAGLSLKNVEALLRNQKSGKILYSGFGEMLFTHFGVSGPLILSASSYYGRREKEEGCVLSLDLKPALTEEQLDRRILRDFEENRNKQFKNAVNGLFPSRLIPVMIEVSGIHPDKKINEITKEERKRFVYRIKHWEMTVTGTKGFEEAVITRGGVSVKDVNPSTMESRRTGGLYFAGEMLDLDALTGGFNLQIAWSTGALAGENIP